MVDERGLVALLYRADWRRLSLSGEVHGGHMPLISMVTRHLPPLRPGKPFPPPPPFEPPPWRDEEADVTLLVAPGKRYRIASPDGRWIRGCDGERVWEWRRERTPDTEYRIYGDLEPPFPELLAPFWLLSGYDLAIEGDATACGRAAVRVVATARGSARDMMPAPLFWGSPVIRADRIVALVDAELGILLRCESRRGEWAPHVAEFGSLTVPAAAGPEQFTAPSGSVFGAGSWPWSVSFPFPFGKAGREVAKTAAGLAAAGLGAAIRCRPRRRPDPFARATEEAADPDAAVPHDNGPAPDGPPDPGAPPVNDEVLHLLQRSGAAEPRFIATLHEWVDSEALLEAVPDSVRKTGFGGVGFLIDTLRDAATGPGTVHLVSSVRIGGWDRYRIDTAAPARDRHRRSGRDRGRRRPRTDACDGRRRWEVYEDRVVESPAAPVPDDVRALADGSWLLGTALSGGEEITVGGRRAYLVTGRSLQRIPWPLLGTLDIRSYPAVAAVDAETGRLLRLTRYAGGKPVTCHELRGIEPDGSDDFGFEPPAGLRVVQEPDERWV